MANISMSLLNSLQAFGAKYNVVAKNKASEVGFTSVKVKRAFNPITGEDYGLNFCCYLPNGSYKSIKASRDSRAIADQEFTADKVEIVELSNDSGENILRAVEL